MDELVIEAEGRDALEYLERIDTTTRGVAVLDALAEMVERAGLGVGDRLPPEVTLAAHLGVGRSTIREALNRWEGLGIIKRKRGAGTFLAARVPSSKSPVPTMIRLEGEALLRLIEVRRALEVEVVRKAALNARPRQKREISRLCDELLAEVYARRPWRPADAAFHGAIYEASGNPMFAQIIAHLVFAFERSGESPFGSDDFGIDSFPPHRVLADAIIAGDPDKAVAAITHILDIVEEEVRTIIRSGPPRR
ncbi:MAG TPA: FadR/GntR family transcriptional regulator [Devosia sp.]|nr:FadR/GntR family transcriptional regulator [Devosia sp.]